MERYSIQEPLLVHHKLKYITWTVYSEKLIQDLLYTWFDQLHELFKGDNDIQYFFKVNCL